MDQTLTEKLIARRAGRSTVRPGEIVAVPVDFLLANDITAPLAIEAFRATGATEVFDRERLAIVLSHFAPARDVRAAVQCAVARAFAREQALPHFYDEGRGGIEHALLPDEGLVLPGDLILGADSHTCTYGGLGAFATGVGSTDLGCAMATGETWLRVPETIRVTLEGRPGPWTTAKDLILAAIGRIGVDGASYRALEFDGEAVEGLSVEGRLTLCNMAIEAGAKNGVVAADARTAAYVGPRARRPWEALAPDPGARYAAHHVIDAGALGPMVARPSSPADVAPVAEVAREVAGMPVDQVFIGSCTNARLEDLRAAAAVLRGRRVAPGTRCIVIAATQAVYASAIAEGLVADLVAAGCQVGAGTCGPCLGGHNGVLGPDEVCVSTSNRNFPGRMGAPSARVYLVSPAVAAATAIAGRLTDPREVADPAPAESLIPTEASAHGGRPGPQHPDRPLARA